MSILPALRAARGPIAKQQILKGANANDKRIFKAAYNQDVSYGISFNHISWPTVRDSNLDDMFDILDSLASRTLSGNLAFETVVKFADLNGDLIKLICNKDLDCGISYGNLDKAFGKQFINKFAVQLAKEVPLEDLVYPLEAQIKYDGVRVVALVKDGTVTFKTRNGKTFKCDGLEQQLLGLGQGNFIFDGELVEASGQSIDRTSVSGRVNSALHGGVLSIANLKYMVFDYMTYEEFMGQSAVHPYGTRYIQMLHRLMQGSTPNIEHSNSVTVLNAQEANELYSSLLSDGYEGLILKSSAHKYTFKRSKDWVKVKAIKTADITCYDVLEGEGKYEGMIGSLMCEGHVDGRDIKVKVGSGLSDCQRGFPESHFIGKCIEVKYNQVIQDAKTGEWSLFIPRFVMVRHDKS